MATLPMKVKLGEAATSANFCSQFWIRSQQVMKNVEGVALCTHLDFRMVRSHAESN